MAQPSPAQEAARQEALEAYLARRISGVGPVRARQLAGHFGPGVIPILDGPAAAAVERLCELRGVGKATAAKFKRSWDAGAAKCVLPFVAMVLRFLGSRRFFRDKEFSPLCNLPNHDTLWRQPASVTPAEHMHKLLWAARCTWSSYVTA